ncbi:hypothetical protein BC828DRAFT_387748 [Blastocladiella britannica]|nr:hypothetical protein BC828DRAFT_387748 [Blastocladiella britannica]
MSDTPSARPHHPDSPPADADAASQSPSSQTAAVPAFRKFRPRFPSARIKKIMQSDEDVGKIANATPVLMSKSLELFMTHLLRATYEQATGQTAPRSPGGATAAGADHSDSPPAPVAGKVFISPEHIRAAVMAQAKLDFLKERMPAPAPPAAFMTAGHAEAAADGVHGSALAPPPPARRSSRNGSAKVEVE